MSDKILADLRDKIQRVRAEAVERCKRMWDSAGSPGEARADADKLVELFEEISALEADEQKMVELAGRVGIPDDDRR